MRSRAPWLFLAVTGLIAASGCSVNNDPDEVSAAFVDAYYVEYDQKKAIPFTDGAATRKIESELKLVEAARSKMQVETQKAKVYYEAPKRRAVGNDLVHFTYTLDIRYAGNSTKRDATVMVGRRDGKWKVFKFHEDGGHALPTSTSTSSRRRP